MRPRPADICVAPPRPATSPSFVAGKAKADECTVITPERQASFTSEEALSELMAGNQEDCVSGKARNCDFLSQVRATAKAQAPMAVVLGCIDCRVPPELILSRRIGDIFTRGQGGGQHRRKPELPTELGRSKADCGFGPYSLRGDQRRY